VIPGSTSESDFAVPIGELYGSDTFPDPGERPGIPPVPLSAIQLQFGSDFSFQAVLWKM